MTDEVTFLNISLLTVKKMSIQLCGAILLGGWGEPRNLYPKEIIDDVHKDS